MMKSALFWLLLNLLSILVLAFFSMSEMACVSFNKIRLQYYVFQKNKRALWLSWLLQKPSRLFSAQLIGVNVATIFGSELAREFYSLFLDSRSRLFLYISNSFGGYFWRISSHVCSASLCRTRRLACSAYCLCIGQIMTPLIAMISTFSQVFSKLIGGKETHGNIFITQEELLKILEEQEEDRPSGEGEEFKANGHH